MSALEQAAAGPSLEDRLREVLPSWTHWGGGAPFFPGFTATWTTTAGTWSIGTSGMSPWPALEGPGGKWAFGSKDADHIIGVLRALDAIPETPALGDVGKCPQCGKQSRSYSRGCSRCGFGSPASETPGTGSADPDGGQR